MIIDEKVIMQPPPPYFSSPGPPPFPGSSSRPRATLTTLPSHILLQIVYATFPQTDSADQDKLERQRKTLYWLSVSLRLVNRVLYVACMHVLRSTHLPAYDRLIRLPYSSDPFPLLAPQNDAPPPTPSSPYTPSSSYSSSSRTQQSPLNTIQRETATLDLFIALKVREDVWADDSELHLERDESFKDLFDLVQPRSRLEDLVRIYGLREGVVTIAGTSKKKPSSTRLGAPSPKSSSSSSSSKPPTPVPAPVPAPTSISTSFFSSLTFSKKSKKATPLSSPAPSPAPPKITPIPFHMLSVSFSPRQVGIVLQPSKRTVVSTARARDERLEVAAKRLVRELKAWLVEGG